MPIGIRDVAREAGVSTQTVSNVLNGRAGASEQTRQRVLETARRLGYSRNPHAASLRSGHPSAIGLLIATNGTQFPADAHQARVLAGITEQILAEEDEIPLLQISRHETPEESDFALFERGSIGVGIIALFLPKPACRRWVEAIEAFAYPSILIGQYATAQNLACVLTDQQQGALEATQHLLRQGHRQIALITTARGTGEIDERRLGYNRGMALWGLRTADRLIVETENTIAGGYEATRNLLKNTPRPSAIVAVNDLLALGGIDAARTAGLQVPDDLAVIGFEDLDFAAHLDPPLSSVRLPDLAMGAAATRLAQSYLRQGSFTESEIVLPTSLQVRASSVADGSAPKSPALYHAIAHRHAETYRPADSARPFRIGASLISIDNPWRLSMHEQLKLAGQREPGIGELVIREAEGSIDRQAGQIQDFIAEGVDALIVDPGAGAALIAPVEQAETSGIPVIMLASTVPTDSYTTKVGPDEVMIGKIAAEDLTSRLGRGNIVVLEGPQGWPVVEDRGRGMAMILSQRRDITVLATASVPQWSRERAREIMHDWLLVFPSIQGILAHDGLLAIGALEAAQEAGRADGLKLGLIGAYNRALKYLAEHGEGKTVLIPSWIGAECVKVAGRILRGERVPKWWDMGVIVIDKSNISDWYDPSRPGEAFESLVHE